jgi:hypothetical protein
MSRSIEFGMPDHGMPKKTPEEGVGKIIPLGSFSEKASSDPTHDSVPEKILAFSKLNPTISRDTYTLHYTELEALSLPELLKMADGLSLEELKNHPSYARALFDLISKKYPR